MFHLYWLCATSLHCSFPITLKGVLTNPWILYFFCKKMTGAQKVPTWEMVSMHGECTYGDVVHFFSNDFFTPNLTLTFSAWIACNQVGSPARFETFDLDSGSGAINARARCGGQRYQWSTEYRSHAMLDSDIPTPCSRLGYPRGCGPLPCLKSKKVRVKFGWKKHYEKNWTTCP